MMHRTYLSVNDYGLHVPYTVVLSFQSINESQVPDALLERLVSGQGEFPPVCAILGGMLGQVQYLYNYSLLL